MKRRLNLLGPGLLLAVLVSLLGAHAIAAGGESELRAVSPVGQELEGTWRVQVSPENPPIGLPPSFPTLNTFMPSGELLETGVGTPPSRRTPGHGEWLRTGDRRFAFTLVFFRFDAEGRYIGDLEASTQIRLARNLRRFRGFSTAVLHDPQGNVVGTFNSTTNGERIEIHEPVDGDSAAESSNQPDE